MKAILYLYSIEPPIYSDLNQAIREMNEEDDDKLSQLGPYGRVLYTILENGIAENNRKDRLNPGSMLGQYQPTLGFFNQTFLLYRGLRLDPKFLADWSAMELKKD